MEKFDFLLGIWTLKYDVPESEFSEAATGNGIGVFRRALNGKYVFFDYEAHLTTGSAQAHGIFARDEGKQVYRYWWFEDSGSYLNATCKFLDENTLFMSWHDTLLIQTFERLQDDKITLTMSLPGDAQNFRPILKVEFHKK